MNIGFAHQLLQRLPTRAQLRRLFLVAVLCSGILSFASQASAQTLNPDVAPQSERSERTPSIIVQDWFEKLLETSSSPAFESQVVRPNEFDVSQLTTSMLEVLGDTFESVTTTRKAVKE